MAVSMQILLNCEHCINEYLNILLPNEYLLGFTWQQLRIAILGAILR